MYGRKPVEPEMNQVCLLLIQRNGMVVVEPSHSEKLDSNVVKALSHKFSDETKAEKALLELNAKYKLSGIFNPDEKIEKLKSFNIGVIKFHVFHVKRNKGCLTMNGNFRFVKVEDLLKEVKVNIKGTGDCIVTPSLKIALELN